MGNSMQPFEPLTGPQRKTIFCLIVAPLLAMFTLMFVPIIFQDLTVRGSYYLFVVLLLSFISSWHLICKHRYGRAVIVLGIPMLVVLPGVALVLRTVMELIYSLLN